MSYPTNSSPQRADTPEGCEANQTIALLALGWILSEGDRAGRFLALTGLDPATLRARVADPALHGAVLAFLTGHEADLIACAHAIGETPGRIAACAERTLS